MPLTPSEGTPIEAEIVTPILAAKVLELGVLLGLGVEIYTGEDFDVIAVEADPAAPSLPASDWETQARFVQP